MKCLLLYLLLKIRTLPFMTLVIPPIHRCGYNYDSTIPLLLKKLKLCCDSSEPRKQPSISFFAFTLLNLFLSSVWDTRPFRFLSYTSIQCFVLAHDLFTRHVLIFTQHCIFLPVPTYFPSFLFFSFTSHP